MGRFERPRERRDSRDGPRRDSRERDQRSYSRDGPRRDRGQRRERMPSFEDRPNIRGRRYLGRESSRNNRRRDVEMTKVTCSSCGVKCEVPFKPTSAKPVYCDDCFAKKDNSKPSKQDFDKINEKLDKIMKALKIE